MNSTTKALWHRHWMDTWGGLLVAAIITMLLSVVFAVWVGLDTTDGNTPLSPETVAFAPLETQSNAREVVAWSAHAFTTVLASLGLILFVHGTGIRSNALVPAHPSIYFNLSLPVSRTRLVVTRFLLSALLALALIGALFLVNAAMAALLDYPVPAREMAETSLVGFLFLVTLVWILDLASIVNELLAGWLIPLAVLVVVAAGWSNVMGLIAGHPVTATRPLILVAISALALVLAIVAARKRDF